MKAKTSKPRFLCIDDDSKLAPLCKAIALHGNLAIESEQPSQTWEKAAHEITDRLTSKKFDGLLLDFRLDEFPNEINNSKVSYTAESLVNELRRRSVEGNDRSYPIVLWSTALNLSWFFSVNPSYTGLYDCVWQKDIVQQHSDYYAACLADLAVGYGYLRTAAKKKQPLKNVLNCNHIASLSEVEQAFASQVKQVPFAFNYATFIINRILAFNGLLIDVDMVTALLGLQDSAMFDAAISKLSRVNPKISYAGVFSTGYRRFWNDALLEQLNGFSSKGYWLHLAAEERVGLLKKNLGLRNLKAAPPIHKSYQTDYDCACAHSGRPLARRNGYRLYNRSQDAWIQPRYIAGTIYRMLPAADADRIKLDTGEAARFASDFRTTK